MGRRWKWFLRPGQVVIDVVRRGVPDGWVTSRCDGARVSTRPAACGPNQRASRYDLDRPGGRRGRAPATGRRADG